MLALGVTACITPLVPAGSVTYTWIEDDSTIATGSLTVSTPLTKPGQLTLPTDATAFSFTVGPLGGAGDFGLADLFGEHPQVNALYQPSGQLEVDDGPNSVQAFNSSQQVLFVEMDDNWAIPGGEDWQAGVDGSLFSGVGHWSITVSASVPEPSSAVLALIAVAGGLACR